MQPDIVGSKITQLKYQGNNIFTLSLQSGEDCYSLSFIGCIMLHDTGCVGNVVTTIDVSEPGFMGITHLSACDKMGLERKEHFSVYMETFDEQTGAKCEIYLAANSIDLSNDPFKYNIL